MDVRFGRMGEMLGCVLSSSKVGTSNYLTFDTDGAPASVKAIVLDPSSAILIRHQ